MIATRCYDELDLLIGLASMAGTLLLACFVWYLFMVAKVSRMIAEVKDVGGDAPPYPSGHVCVIDGELVE